MTIWECSFRKKGLNRERAFDNLGQRAKDFLFSDQQSIALLAEPLSQPETYRWQNERVETNGFEPVPF